MSAPSDIRSVVERYRLGGKLVGVEPLTAGHINDSYVLRFRRPRETVRFLLQRINDSVFQRPDLVMENIVRVTAHIARRLRTLRLPDIDRRVLMVFPTTDGRPFCRDDDGGCWRLYQFVEGTGSFTAVATAEQAEQAARAFGEFHGRLADFPAADLHETIPGFHDTPRRFQALERAVRADSHRRLAAAGAEVDFALDHRASARALLDLQQAGALPLRVVHNDAKISNVLFDEKTGEALCVVDLDTVMPGLVLQDFGDMVRSMATTATEDQRDLSRVAVQLPLFEALARGYLAAAGEFLTRAERDHLVLSGRLLTLEQGVRFLTDFLSGDTYYKTQRPDQNLDRCRTQFKLLQSIIRHERQMTRFVAGL